MKKTLAEPKLKPITMDEYEVFTEMIRNILYNEAFEMRQCKLDELEGEIEDQSPHVEEDLVDLRNAIIEDLKLEPDDLIQSVFGDDQDEGCSGHLFEYYIA